MAADSSIEEEGVEILEGAFGYAAQVRAALASIRSVVSVALIAGLAVGCGASIPGGGAPNATNASDAKGRAAPNAETRALHALFDEDWEATMREEPVWASELGDMRYADRWPDVGLAAQSRREARDRETLARLKRIPSSALSPDDRLSYDLFAYRLEEAVRAQPFRLHLLALDQRHGIQTSDDLSDVLPFGSSKDFADYDARLRAFGTYMDQTIALLEEGIRVGLTQPRIVMTRIPAQIDAQIVTDPTKSPFYAPFEERKERKAGAHLPPEDEARFAASARRAIAEVVVPAFQRMKTFFVERYLPACREQIGAWQLPNGPALYAHLVRVHTTTNLTPDQVHAIGLREVARIRTEMERVKAETGFTGSMKEFFAFLRTDPRFFYKTGPELIAAYRTLAKRIDPELVKVFRKLPRTPYGVAAIPDHVAPDTSTAYYREPAADGSRAGTFFVNLYKPEARPTWEMVALTLHEAVPGHHLQIALAAEQENLPRFRRHGEYTAFVEGWALYAESLGHEMGVYDDAYAKFGQLTYEMWRAVRLVVDTGIHHLRWDRQRAIDLFMENAPKAELDVINEIDRYIAWPGQALAYKLGELRIKELRTRAARALGPRFDLRAFHDVVLRQGPLPLDLLQRQVEEGMLEPQTGSRFVASKLPPVR